MKLLIDECLPRKLKNHLPGIECQTVPEAGLAGRKNGELLSLAERAGFPVLLTIDRGIEFEQNLRRRKIAVVLIHARSSRLDDLLPHAPEILRVLGSIRSGQLVKVG
jgi:predicted nuclease of predicted toxin-antitoxin system